MPNMNSLKNNNKMETKVVSFEQMPELIQNLVERIEALEKTVREKQQPQPLEGELMSVEDVCKLPGKSKSAVYRTVRCHDIPFIRSKNESLRIFWDFLLYIPHTKSGREGTLTRFLLYQLSNFSALSWRRFFVKKAFFAINLQVSVQTSGCDCKMIARNHLTT